MNSISLELNRLFIHNTPDGSCATISFYQFVKLTGSMTYENIITYLKSIFSKFEHKVIDSFEPIIRRWWDGIHFGELTPDDLPTRNNELILNEPIAKMGYWGTSEYNVINYFMRYIAQAQTGIFLPSIIDKCVKDIRYSRILSYLNKYDSFIDKFTSIVPYVCFVALFDELTGIIKEDIHMKLMIYDKTNDLWINCNSNDDDLYIADSYKPISFILCANLITNNE